MDKEALIVFAIKSVIDNLSLVLIAVAFFWKAWRKISDHFDAQDAILSVIKESQEILEYLKDVVERRERFPGDTERFKVS